MVKTTVYLPEDLKQRLEEAARVSGESEARIIRSALEGWLESLVPRPRSNMMGTIDFGDPDLAFKVDDFDSAYQRLKDQGIPFLTEAVRKSGNSTVFFSDPDGNILHLLHRETPLP